MTIRASRNTALLHLASTTPPAVFANVIGVDIGRRHPMGLARRCPPGTATRPLRGDRTPQASGA